MSYFEPLLQAEGPDGLESVSAALLAGGKSARMGRDKATLPFRGATLLEWQVDKLRGLGVGDIMLSGCGRTLPGTRLIPDDWPGRGPLSGMHACLKRALHPDCLVLSVDAPLVPPQALAALARAHRASGAAVTLLCHGGKWEPLMGVYRRELFQAMEPLLLGEDTAVRRLLDHTGFETLDWPGEEALFLNCNTPEDYRRLQALAGRPSDTPQ